MHVHCLRVKRVYCKYINQFFFMSDISIRQFNCFSNNLMNFHQKKTQPSYTRDTIKTESLCMENVDEMKRNFDMQRKSACKIIIAFIVLICNISRLISVLSQIEAQKYILMCYKFLSIDWPITSAIKRNKIE